MQNLDSIDVNKGIMQFYHVIILLQDDFCIDQRLAVLARSETRGQYSWWGLIIRLCVTCRMTSKTGVKYWLGPCITCLMISKTGVKHRLGPCVTCLMTSKTGSKHRLGPCVTCLMTTKTNVKYWLGPCITCLMTTKTGVKHRLGHVSLVW